MFEISGVRGCALMLCWERLDIFKSVAVVDD